MMDEMMGPMFLGYPLEIVLMWASGIFYLICAAIIWKPFREEKNELLGALFAFLVYQAISMFFMGLGLHTMNMIYENIAALAILIGSAYMLKFPFSSFSSGTRKLIFGTSIIVVLGLFVWFVISPVREMSLVNFSIWYDVYVNGVVVGLFMIIVGLRSHISWLKIKALGGGSGVVSCCIVSNVAMVSGALAVASVFQFVAPIIIVTAIYAGRRKQQQAVPTTTAPVNAAI